MSEPIKPAKYYICMDSKVQREQVQINFENIKHKVRLTNGEILDEALRMYWKSVKGAK
jgi:hypothetical protein